MAKKIFTKKNLVKGGSLIVSLLLTALVDGLVNMVTEKILGEESVKSIESSDA